MTLPLPGDVDLLFPLCNTVPDLEAPADWYRDEPVYVVNEQPKEPVRDWAQQQPDFEGLWLDRDHLGWITLGFSGPVDDYQAKLEELSPEIGVVAVQVPFTQAELDEVHGRVRALLAGRGFGGIGTNLNSAIVTVSLGVLVPERVDLLTPLAGEPICLEGAPAGSAVKPGPQPDGGDGWRLLADEKVGPSYRTGVATAPDQYDELWRSIGLAVDPPPVDFNAEIVVWFGAVYGSGCEIRLDDVVVDADAALVHALTVIPSNPSECNLDANPRAYLVALDRSRLPLGPFMVQLRATDPPRGVPEERTLVAVDLSAPGSTAADNEIGFDPSLPVVGAQSLAETYPFPGEPVTFPIGLDCAAYVDGDCWWRQSRVLPSCAGSGLPLARSESVAWRHDEHGSAP